MKRSGLWAAFQRSCARRTARLEGPPGAGGAAQAWPALLYAAVALLAVACAMLCADLAEAGGPCAWNLFADG